MSSSKHFKALPNKYQKIVKVWEDQSLGELMKVRCEVDELKPFLNKRIRKLKAKVSDCRGSSSRKSSVASANLEVAKSHFKDALKTALKEQLIDGENTTPRHEEKEK